MSHQRHTILASRPAAMVLALSLLAGLSAPFVILPPVRAAVTPPTPPPDTTELSPAPVDQTQDVPPNIVLTFDDSSSMEEAELGDYRPFDGGGWESGWATNTHSYGLNPWSCANVINPSATSGIGAHVMNGVYYNPHVTYVPPVDAHGNPFPEADATLQAVQNDGILKNSPLSQIGLSPNYASALGVTNFLPGGTDYWQCQDDAQVDYTLRQDGNHYKSVMRVAGGGPYYYQLKASALTTLEGQLDAHGSPTSAGLSTLYNRLNWEAVKVGSSGILTDTWQNWANWWAYYRTRIQAAQTAVSLAFGSPDLAATTQGGGYGSDIRVAWQNLFTTDYSGPSGPYFYYKDKFLLQPNQAIISALMDASGCNSNDIGTSDPGVELQSTIPFRAPPGCYRSAFFNWLFSVQPKGETPTRAATIRTGEFFTLGSGNTGSTGDLHDPYWQPPTTGVFDKTTNPGSEPYCRQNFHMLITDGYWHESDPALPTDPAGSPFKDVNAGAGLTLPDGVVFSNTADVSKIFWNNQGIDYPSSMANIAFNYWATDLRPDLYDPPNGKFVPPYLPDTTLNVIPGGNIGSGNGNGAAKGIPAEEYFNPNNDPATWPHVVQYMVTLGVFGTLSQSDDYDCKSHVGDACALRTGATTSEGSVGWPQAVNNTATVIDDTWHAAVNGRGIYFNAGNPADLIEQLDNILSNVTARAATQIAAGVNASVATSGALSFDVGQGADWSGLFQAVVLNADGSVDNTPVWDAGAQLDARAAGSRTIYTAAYSSGTLTSFEFKASNVASIQADAFEKAGLGGTSTAPDTPDQRINYLRGDHSLEGSIYRKRTHLLGAIIHSQPVYVAYPSGNYSDSWPATSPEASAPATDSYDSFVAIHANRAPTVYVGANDGMLHAFNAPVPQCTSHDPATGACSNYNYGTNPGKEDWAFIPRAVYANLGNLTSLTGFHYRATVDATPVTRDVFFSENGKHEWHTLLAGGVGVGGRGAYALDITDPSTPFSASDVLWEFDSDMAIPSTCVSIMGKLPAAIGCRATDLGYTVSQPNIARLALTNPATGANGKWAVLVPNGYFPDCSKSDIPTADKTHCAAIAAQAPKDASGKPYSALFVLDAQTGKVIAELKTPTNIPGIGDVASFGLATPVVGDYDNDQIDDVAFAGDLQGNLWRFDLSGTAPSAWTVTLVYQGLTDASGQGLQPITTMPRLFPDPVTNRFMVVFGTGKYLGAGDNATDTEQAIYGVRDVEGTSYTQADLTQRYLSEKTLTSGANTGATLRCVAGASADTCDSPTPDLTSLPAPSEPKGGGWFINLYTIASDGTQTDKGERVVVNPGAIFASNTVVFETLLTGASGSEPCHPTIQGAIMALDAITGGPAGVSSLGGGWSVVGGRISNARTSGSLPIVSALGGGQAYLPGVTLAPGGTNPFTLDAPIWRRRSWHEIIQNQ